MKRILRKFILYANVVFAVFLILSFLSSHLSPEKIWFPAFLGLAYPYILLVNVIFLLGWIILKRKELLISLLAWYRVEWDHHQLMNEISQLLSDLLSPYIDLAESCFVTYQAAFQDVLGINPHNVSKDDLIACTEKAGLGNVLDKEEHRDRFLELLFSHKIEPVLGKEGGIKRGIKEEKNTDKPCICFLYNYPASQAALAKTVLESGHLIAERFEVFINGMELGNGFHELNDSAEQKARFEADNRFRKALEKVAIPMDERFLAALDYLPECAGVALGIERLLMVMSRSQDISEVIAFPFDRA